MSKRTSSSVSSGGKAAKRMKKEREKPGNGFDVRWRFKIEPQPPKFPFCGEFFDLNVYLVDQEGNPMLGWEVPIVLDLFVEGESVPVTSGTTNSRSIEISEDTPPKIDKRTGCASLKVKVLELSMNRGNRKFCFMVKRRDGPRGNLPRDVNPVMTRAMLVVNAQIRVMNELPEVWYKDQGGKDKCIEIYLELWGPHGLVTGQEVPLKCVLLYEDFKQVIQQDVLVPSPTTVLSIGPTGKTQIKLRIEDVSKNHQSRRFRIRVEPDTSLSPVHFDKSSDVTSPVLVRSKLNKRQKLKLAQKQKTKENLSTESKNPNHMSGPIPQASNAHAQARAQAMHQQAMAMMNAGVPIMVPNGKPGVQDISTLPPELASAVWSEHARETLAMVQAVASRLIVQYDSTIRPYIRSRLAGANIQPFPSTPGQMPPNVQRTPNSGAQQSQTRPPTTRQQAQTQSTRRRNLRSSTSGVNASASGEMSMGNPRMQNELNATTSTNSMLPSAQGEIPQNHQQHQELQESGKVQEYMRETSQLVRGLSQSLNLFPNDVDLSRELSVFTFGDQDLPLSSPSRLNSLAPEGFSSRNPAGRMSATPPPSLRVSKRQRSRGTRIVAFIIEKRLNSSQGPCVLAFDKEKRFAGLYRYIPGSDLVFLAPDQSNLPQPEIDSLILSVDAELHSNSSNVKQIIDDSASGWDIAKKVLPSATS